MKKTSDSEIGFIILFFVIVILAIGCFVDSMAHICALEKQADAIEATADYEIDTGIFNHYGKNVVVTDNCISFYDVFDKQEITFVNKSYILIKINH